MKRRSSIVALLAATLFVAALLPISWASAGSEQPYAAREGETYLPLASFAEPPTPTPTPTPSPTPQTPIEAGTIAVLNNHSTYAGSLGRLIIVGEVQSGLDVSAKLVEVTVKMFNGGSVVAEDFTRLFVDMLPAGEKTCFRMSVYPPPAAWTHYELDTSWVEGGYDRPTLSARDVSGDFSTGYYRLTGAVRNDGGTTARLVRAIGTLYGADGRVVDCAYANTREGLLVTGQESAFKISYPTVRAGAVASYRLQTDGSVQTAVTVR